jgi:hypothetical protein
VLLLVPPLRLLHDSEPHDIHNVQRLAILVLLIEGTALLVVLTCVVGSLLGRAWRHAPRGLTWVTAAAVAGGVVAGWYGSQACNGLSGLLKQSLTAAVAGVAVALVAVGVLLLASTSRASLQTIEAALHHRDGADRLKTRGRTIFRTMAIAAVPGISELAEATEPPFRKSFLVVEPRCADDRTTAIVFAFYGVDDERAPETTGHPAQAAQPGPDEPSRGSYLVDRLTVELRPTGA